MPQAPILVTGGAGFIGSNFVLQWLAAEDTPVVNLDKLTYAGNLHNLDAVSADPRYTFVHGDVGDRTLIAEILDRHRPRAIVHFAAESHVDRSIHGPDDFVRTNINGTFNLIEEVRAYWTARDSRITVTLICPGYSSSFSISRAISYESKVAASSSIAPGATITRISRPACIA